MADIERVTLRRSEHKVMLSGAQSSEALSRLWRRVWYC